MLERDRYQCRVRLAGCTIRATCVHHLDGKAAGDDPARMVASCTSCNLKAGEPGRPRNHAADQLHADQAERIRVLENIIAQANPVTVHADTDRRLQNLEKIAGAQAEVRRERADGRTRLWAAIAAVSLVIVTVATLMTH